MFAGLQASSHAGRGCLLLTMLAHEPHGFWEKLVAVREQMLSLLRPVGWYLVAALFMLAVIAAMRAAGRADRPEM